MDTQNSQVLTAEQAKGFVPPTGWECLAPGDAALTRKVKAAGPTITIQEKRGRKIFSKGVWADAQQIKRATQELEALRSTEKYAKTQVQTAARREKKQEAYVEDFNLAVLQFLNFAACHRQIAIELADLVSAHATPVGSGTVARTERIPIQQRAQAAVIAWMRHQTTGYDNMKIARVKGKRREVRRELAEQSSRLLSRYRSGQPIESDCPLVIAVSQSQSTTPT